MSTWLDDAEKRLRLRTTAELLCPENDTLMLGTDLPRALSLLRKVETAFNLTIMRAGPPLHHRIAKIIAELRKESPK